MFVCFSSLLTISLSFHLLVVFSVPNNPILDTRISCSVLLLSHAQGNPPGFCNGLDWRALVELRPPPLAKLREQNFLFYFLEEKKCLFEIFWEIFSRFLDFWQFLTIYGFQGSLWFFCFFGIFFLIFFLFFLFFLFYFFLFFLFFILIEFFWNCFDFLKIFLVFRDSFQSY